MEHQPYDNPLLNLQLRQQTATSTMSEPVKKPNIYLEQKIMTASPEELIKYLYDAGIIACKRNQKAKALAVLQELVNSLRFDHIEVAMSFYRTYSAVMDLIGRNEWDRAIIVLTEIRSTWVTAMNLK